MRDRFHAAGFFVDVDDTHHTLNKKIREAQVSQYNYIFVVGEKEEADETVNIRTRDNEVQGTKKVAEVIAELRDKAENHENR